VILTPRAAERIALETGQVTEEPVDRFILVSGEVETFATPPAEATISESAPGGDASGSFARVPALPAAAGSPDAGGIIPVRVRVPPIESPAEEPVRSAPVLLLQEDEDDDDDDDEDLDDATDDVAVILIRPDGDGMAPLKAKPVEVASTGDQARYYEVINGGSHVLQPGQSVQVRLPHPENGTPKKVIPFSAVIYSPDGKAWTYTMVEPLTFVRHAIDIEFVAGDRAVLREGPPTGTAIVTTGAAELWGVETKNG
jgi:hypothetical protein